MRTTYYHYEYVDSSDYNETLKAWEKSLTYSSIVNRKVPEDPN